MNKEIISTIIFFIIVGSFGWIFLKGVKSIIAEANTEQVQMSASVSETAENCRTTCEAECLNKFK